MKYLLLVLFVPYFVVAQHTRPFEFKKIQSGPYVGVQQGKHIALELGFEKRIKEVKLIRPLAHAFNVGANYDIKAGLLGADAGYWFRPSRISFTMGLQAAVRTNFEKSSFGLSPTIGYKIWFLHANAGYYLYPNPIPGVQTNRLFIQLRMVFTEKTKVRKTP